jgi:hypothetical protein
MMRNEIAQMCSRNQLFDPAGNIAGTKRFITNFESEMAANKMPMNGADSSVQP